MQTRITDFMTERCRKVVTTLNPWLIDNGDENNEEACPLCGKRRWKRIVDDFNVLLGCEVCGYYKVEEELHNFPMPTITGKDQWSGVIDNIERLLEDRVSRRGWS